MPRSQAEVDQQVVAEKGVSRMVSKRRNLELARVDILARMERAQVPAHRQMLEKALADLDKQLKNLS